LLLLLIHTPTHLMKFGKKTQREWMLSLILSQAEILIRENAREKTQFDIIKMGAVKKVPKRKGDRI